MLSATEELIREQKDLVAKQAHLANQDINLDVSTMTPLTPEIISRQATINIGTIGHVAHGKSTLVRAISGVNVSQQSYILPHTYSPSLLHRLYVITRNDSETSL